MAVAVAVGKGVRVSVAVDVLVEVFVGNGVYVDVAVGKGVCVNVAVDVDDGVYVNVAVGVAVGPKASGISEAIARITTTIKNRSTRAMPIMKERAGPRDGGDGSRLYWVMAFVF